LGTIISIILPALAVIIVAILLGLILRRLSRSRTASS
jgi:hypothetical protein